MRCNGGNGGGGGVVGEEYYVYSLRERGRGYCSNILSLFCKRDIHKHLEKILFMKPQQINMYPKGQKQINYTAHLKLILHLKL
jgi:hypothetical protein